MQFTAEQKLDRLHITDTATINGHQVYRVSTVHYVVDGVIVRRGHESDARFRNRLLFAVTDDPKYDDVDEGTKKKREAAKERKQKQKHACIDCGQDCFKPYPRCRKCAYEHRRQYPYEPCKVCGRERAPYRAGGRGSREMLNAAGVCPDCREEYARRITAGEMEP